jgi:ethanolamine permease
MVEQVAPAPSKQINLLKVLGPVHVWALGVGIVLVGEFMGWNPAGSSACSTPAWP